MARIRARNLLVEFPIYSASTRSLKNAVLHATTGGKVARDSGRRITVTALDHVSFDLHEGDRVGVMGHKGRPASVSSIALHSIVPKSAYAVPIGLILIPC